MEELSKRIENYHKEISTFDIGNNGSAESFRIKYLGTKGIIKAVMAEMKNVAAENKKTFGQ